MTNIPAQPLSRPIENSLTGDRITLIKSPMKADALPRGIRKAAVAALAWLARWHFPRRHPALSPLLGFPL